MNSNDTTVPATAAYTTEQREKFELLLQQKGIVPVTFHLPLECGILSDLLDPPADLTNRLVVQRSVRCPNRLPHQTTASAEVAVAAGNTTDERRHRPSASIVGEGRLNSKTPFHFDKDVSSAAAIAQIAPPLAILGASQMKTSSLTGQNPGQRKFR